MKAEILKRSSHVVILEGRVAAEKLDACLKLFAENRLEVTKNYEGCEGCFGSVNPEESLVTIWTQWQSPEHFDSYLKWRTDRGDLAEALSYFDGEPNIKRSSLFFE